MWITHIHTHIYIQMYIYIYVCVCTWREREEWAGLSLQCKSLTSGWSKSLKKERRNDTKLKRLRQRWLDCFLTKAIYLDVIFPFFFFVLSLSPSLAFSLLLFSSFLQLLLLLLILLYVALPFPWRQSKTFGNRNIYSGFATEHLKLLPHEDV